MSNRFSYIRYDEIHTAKQARFKDAFESLEAMIDELPQGRAKALVLTKIEEAYMWVGKAIRDNQISLNGSAEEEIKRGEK